MTNDEEISSLLTELTSSSSTQVDSASLKLGEFLLANDLSLFGPSTIDNLLKASSHSSVHAKVGAYAAFDSLANLIKSPIEPLLMPLIPALILSFADKNKNVQKYALKAASSIVNLVSPMCIDLVLPYLFQGMDSDRKWQSQVGSINLLVQLIPRCSTAISIRLAVIVPVVRDAICNIRTEVQEAATNCMLKLCAVIGNPDVEKVLPNVVMCMGDPLKIPDAVEKVSETTFVKAVGAPLLSVMVCLINIDAVIRPWIR